MTKPASNPAPDSGEHAALITPSSPEVRKRAFRLLFFCLLCLGMGQSLMFSVLPPVARELKLGEFSVGMIFATSATIWVLVSPWWGRRSDVWGRRPVILIGLLGYAISTVLFTITVDLGLAGMMSMAFAYPLMIATRCIYGLLGPGAMTAAQAYVADRTSRSERTQWVAALGAAFGLGATIGPGFSSALVVFGLLAPFYAVSVLALASAVAIWFLLPERTRPLEGEHSSTLSPLDRRILPHLVVGTLIGIAQAITIQTVGFLFMDTLKLPPDQAVQFVGVGLMASSLAAIVAQLVLVQRFAMTSTQLLNWGCGTCVGAFALFLVSHSYGPLVTALVLTGLGFGLARPGITAAGSLAVARHEQGAVAGLTGATGASGFVFGPLIGMPLYQIDPMWPYWLNLLLVAGCFVYVGTSRRIRAADAPQDPAGEVDVNAESGVPKG